MRALRRAVKIDGVGIFHAEKWVNSVVSVERRSERVMIVKLVLDERLVNVFLVYAAHAGKPDEEQERSGTMLFVMCVTG